MKPEIAFRRAMDSASQAIDTASTALNQCAFSGPCQAAAQQSKMNLLMELIHDEPAEIGVSPSILEKCGVE